MSCVDQPFSATTALVVVRVAKALQSSEIDGFLAKPFRVEAVVAMVAMVAELGADGRRHPIRSGAEAHLALNQPGFGSPRCFLYY